MSAMRIVYGFLAILLIALSACQNLSPSPKANQAETPPLSVSVSVPTSMPQHATATPYAEQASTDQDPDAAAVPEAVDSVAYTYQQPDGNRIVAGRGSLPDGHMLDIPLTGTPRWIVATALEAATMWAVALDDGQIQAFRVSEVGVQQLAIMPEQLPPGMPPLLAVQAGHPVLITAPSPDASPLTHPVVLDGSGLLAFIDSSGDVVLWAEGEVARFPVDALPDARLLVDEDARLLLLAGATTRYDHGVLGDSVEASSITLIETTPTPRIVVTISIPTPQVIEGTAPIWADLTGDGVREIVVTVSDASQGAQVIVFDEAGNRIAAGPAIGRGYRWRHQLAVAPFGPDGELELADVLTPHIGGVVEFYRLEGSTLRTVARAPGYTSHVLGTRNLDMAVSGDFDGDGHIELLLPVQARTALGAIRHTGAGAEMVWTLPLDGQLATNVGVAMLDDGSLAVGVGREDGVLRLWLP